jgi:hypothetical protein
MVILKVQIIYEEEDLKNQQKKFENLGKNGSGGSAGARVTKDT